MQNVNDETVCVFGCPLPKVLAGTARHRITDHKREGNGHDVSAAYLNALYSLTIYVYDQEVRDIPDGISSSVVVDQFKLTVQALMSVEAAQGVTLLCREAFPAVIGGATEPSVLIARLGLAGDGDSYHTFVHMTARNGHFIKIRTTLTQPSVSGAGMTDVVVAKYIKMLQDSGT